MKHGSLINHIAAPAVELELGDGATLCHWSDREAFTVIAKTKSGKTVTLQADTATRSDANGMSDAQTYTYERNPAGRTIKARLTSRGWSANGTKVIPGRHAYYDFSF
jgi:non-ribosomal peptide synthetase component E (peptide arylation enzyme)